MDIVTLFCTLDMIDFVNTISWKMVDMFTIKSVPYYVTCHGEIATCHDINTFTSFMLAIRIL